MFTEFDLLLIYSAILLKDHKLLHIKVFLIYEMMDKKTALKMILKFTLKQPLHVSVQSPSSGSVLFELAKVMVIKIIS